MSSNQKRIRDVERMIKRFGNTPDLVAKLEAAKQSKGEVQVKEKMRKNSTKYHMVKFMERKKTTRSIRSVETKIKNEEDPAKLSTLNKKRDELMDDLAYIMYDLRQRFLTQIEMFITFLALSLCRYYPMEHKYIALFPSKNKDNKQDGEDSDGEEDVEKSKAISKKARQVALQRWKEDQSLGGDKVAYAMEVEYKGGAAAAESAPGKAIAASKEQQRAQLLEKKSKKTAEKKAGDKAKKAPPAAKNSATNEKSEKESDDASSGSDSSSDSSDSSSSSSDSESSDNDSAPTPAKTSIKPTEKKSEAKKEPTKVVAKEESEGSDNDNDDFFMEEASESEQINVNAAPKVYQDGNSFRYKEERKNVHEIRFASTKRKFEHHKRVYNNKKQHAPRK